MEERLVEVELIVRTLVASHGATPSLQRNRCIVRVSEWGYSAEISVEYFATVDVQPPLAVETAVPKPLEGRSCNPVFKTWIKWGTSRIKIPGFSQN